ncbi:phage major tail tube protein [Vibrio sp. YMD68]|uniref:phage major tail tube protein n=1 Tax=Vibrio sp. YMD68 TaxID=3042300 RepID=UPI00249AF372|nr:phage major tail tube protein [Vibrio sp. YMD68]WGV98819.1 phage major tail tube protein [Vibrio sp. YMD68]WGW01254.1 phage major tail tube protein [Vibrio sp. YMD68]
MAKVLRDINVFAGETSFFGKASEVTLPNIEWATETFNTAGMAMETEEILRLLAMNLEMTFRDPCPKMVGYVGNPAASEEPITIRGAVTEKGTTQKIEIKANGTWKSMEPSTFTAGGAEYTNKFIVNLDFYAYYIDNKETFYVSNETGVVRSNGVDITKSIRDALGV